MKNSLIVVAVCLGILSSMLTHGGIKAAAQEASERQKQASPRLSTVTPAPNQSSFKGVIGSTVGESVASWPELAKATKGAILARGSADTTMTT